MYTGIDQSQIPIGHAPIGTCSICGGPVCVPQMWHSIQQPIPACARCGAIQACTFGPVIEMQPLKQCVSVWTTDFVIDGTSEGEKKDE